MTAVKFKEYSLWCVYDKNEDFICIIKVMNDDVFGEETLGKKDIVTGETLIL